MTTDAEFLAGYAKLFEAALEPVVVVDGQNAIASWNQAAVDVFGWSAEEAIGRDFSLLLVPERFQAVHHEGLLRRVAERTEVAYPVHEQPRLRRDGSEVPSQIRVSKILSPGGAPFFVGFFRILGKPASQPRSAEMDAAAARENATLIARVCHELRTPMTGVIGMASLLASTRLNPVQRDYVDTIRGSGEHLLDIVNEILDFARVAADRIELESRPFEVRELVESSVELVAAAAADKAIELVSDVAPATPRVVVGDLGRTRQILLNLLGNAVKFTARGHVVVRVSPIANAGDGPNLSFSVSDTGIGIPQEQLPHVFDAFSNLSATTAATHGGTGLGMAISMRMVELMGGTIEVDSTRGVGTTFRFTIRAPVPRDRIERRTLDSVPQLFNKRALLVVNDDALRSMLKATLESWGIQVTADLEPEAALERFRLRQGLDVALVDHPLAAGDSNAFGAIAQPRGPRLLRLASMATRGDPHPGYDAVIAKPVRPSQLATLLGDVFAGVAPSSEETRSAVLPRNATSLRVLVAEDNAVSQKVIVAMLEKLGHRPTCAANGREAIEQVVHGRYDLVLMDVQMPEIDGLAATKEIRERLVGRRMPAIVGLTANALESDRQRCLAAGMVDHLAKPITLARLADRIALLDLVGGADS